MVHECPGTYLYRMKRISAVSWQVATALPVNYPVCGIQYTDKLTYHLVIESTKSPQA